MGPKRRYQNPNYVLMGKTGRKSDVDEKIILK
jgi:hypothetical protein